MEMCGALVVLPGEAYPRDDFAPGPSEAGTVSVHRETVGSHPSDKP